MTPVADEAYGEVALAFEANVGQSDVQVRFLAHGNGYTAFLTPAEAVLDLRTSDRASADGFVLRMQLVGSNSTAPSAGQGELAGAVNYITGRDPSRWQTDVPTYARAVFDEVYPGIDVAYYGNQRELEYDFLVAPGADPGCIGLRFAGADSITVDSTGDLVLRVGDREVVQHAPVLYQEAGGARLPVAGGYDVRSDGTVGFAVGDYDRARPLVIDPVLSYGTYLGGSGYDAGNAVAVDAAGSAYVTGQTGTATFPTTAGAYRTALGGTNNAAFVAKLNPAGTGLAYATYLGGGDLSHTVGYGIAVDAAGSAYVTGETASVDFPVTPGAFQSPNIGGYDAFVTKLTPQGNGLAYSLRIASGFDDFGRGIAVDAGGNAVITGVTQQLAAGALPIPLVNAAQPAFGGGPTDAFVTKVNPTGSGLVFSTYLGGGAFLNASQDEGHGVAVDPAGNVYVTGFTFSIDFPTTPGAFMGAGKGGGGLDAFVTKFTPAGAVAYSTFLGSVIGSDNAWGISADAAGSAYVTGDTNAWDDPATTANEGFPTTPGAFQRNLAGQFDAFVTKLRPDGSGLVYSTYLCGSSDAGGSGADRGWAVAVDSAGSAHVTGDTGSANFPLASPVQAAYGGGSADVFVTKLDPTGSAPAFSTFLGGELTDQGKGVAVEAAGAVYVTGVTSSFQFPTTGGAFQPANAGGLQHHDDAFVAKISGTGSASVWLSALALSPSLVTAGGTSVGTVTLSAPAPAGGAVVALSTGRPDIAIVPPTVTVPAGAVSASFTIATTSSLGGWTGRAGAIITASFGGVDRSQLLEVDYPAAAASLSGLTVNPASVTGGTAATGTVTLSGPAPAGGLVVSLSSGNTAVARVPASVTVPAGATSVNFTVTTTAVTANTVVTLTATAGGVTRSAALTVTPRPADTVRITRAEYTVSKRVLRVQATSTSSAATLRVYVTGTNELIGTLTNLGGKYIGQFTWPINPQSVTVRSSLGGTATQTVTAK